MLILINGGASHNFADEEFVVNINGDKTFCKKVVKHLKVDLGKYSMVSAFYIFSMGGYPNMIFGIQLLECLGKLTSDYGAHWMSFKANGNKVTLRGFKDVTCEKVAKGLKIIFVCKEEDWSINSYDWGGMTYPTSMVTLFLFTIFAFDKRSNNFCKEQFSNLRCYQLIFGE